MLLKTTALHPRWQDEPYFHLTHISKVNIIEPIETLIGSKNIAHLTKSIFVIVSIGLQFGE